MQYSEKRILKEKSQVCQNIQTQSGLISKLSITQNDIHAKASHLYTYICSYMYAFRSVVNIHHSHNRTMGKLPQTRRKTDTRVSRGILVYHPPSLEETFCPEQTADRRREG